MYQVVLRQIVFWLKLIFCYSQSHYHQEAWPTTGSPVYLTGWVYRLQSLKELALSEHVVFTITMPMGMGIVCENANFCGSESDGMAANVQDF